MSALAVVCAAAFQLGVAPLGSLSAAALQEAPQPAVTEPAAAEDAELVPRLEAEIAPYVEARDFMGAVLIARGERILLRRAYGLASVELGVPNTPETVFAIASISKYLTALAVAKLEDEGRLSLDDALARFLPDFPGSAEITLVQLLGHRSGLQHRSYSMEDDRELLTPIDSAELVARIGRLPRLAPPGTLRSYSTAGYSVLARVIEVVTGESYGMAMRELIFDPAGMKASADIAGRRPIPGRAVGHEPDFGGGLRRARPIAFENKLGGGSLCSTVDDLWRLHLALEQGRVVRPEVRARVEASWWGGDVMRNGPFELFGSNGGLDGFVSVFDQYRSPDGEGLCLVVLSNVNSGAREPLRDALSSIALGLEWTRPQRPARAEGPPRSTWPQLEGRFLLGSEGEWDVRACPDGLTIGATPSTAMPLDPLGPARFFLRARYVTLEFLREDGRVSRLLWTENGRTRECLPVR